MKRSMKRYLALLLCLVLCLSLFPAAGFAEGGEAAAGEITVGEQVPAEEPEEAADADVVEEEESAADMETEQVVPEEPADVLIEDDADKAIAAEAEEPEEDAERRTGSTEQVEGFVRRGYSLMLGREADADGLQFYVDLLTSGQLSGAQMVSNFMHSPEFTDKKVSNEEAVTILYRVMMNREPDADGLAYHKANLDRGLSYNCVINNFSGSPEFGDICAESGITPGTVGLEWRDQNPLVTDFVNRNYLYALERKGEGDGLNYYCQILLEKTRTPQQVAHGFVFSPECINRGLNDRAFIEMLYHLYMGREADEGGLNYYLNALNSGTTRETVAAGFARSREFRDIVISYGLYYIPITAEFFPDDIFRGFIAWYFDPDHDGILSMEELGSVTEIDCSDRGIFSVEGIELFTELEVLNCAGNNLRELNVRENARLAYLTCGTAEYPEEGGTIVHPNMLTQLDVSRNPLLTELWCPENELTELDVSSNPLLVTLNCGDNRLNSLTIGNQSNLEELYCWGNEMTSLNVSGCPALKDLQCEGNHLQSLDVSACPNLTYLYVSDEYLQEDGTYLVKANDLSVLDLSNNHMLESILCFDNRLTRITLACSNHLKGLYCSGNQLSSLNLAGYTALEELYCWDNRLTMLDLSNCWSLQTIYYGGNPLEVLNLSGCTAMEQLNTSDFTLRVLNVSDCTGLTAIYCAYNNLNSMNVSGCTALNTLVVLGNPQLSTLDISQTPILKSLVYSVQPKSYTDAVVYETEEAVLAIDHNTRLSY